jgi:hypothetical protein
MTKKDQKQKELDLQKALEVLFASEYINKHKLYLHNFLRGIFFGAGGVIGATLLIAFLLWILSIFDTVPLIGPFIDNTRSTIQQGTGSN